MKCPECEKEIQALNQDKKGFLKVNVLLSEGVEVLEIIDKDDYLSGKRSSGEKITRPFDKVDQIRQLQEYLQKVK